ncbi:MAG: zinc-dependent alcohol dehydrogenase family protein [Gammaproteobacteria bacterium]|nr:zinc-dependent alcohol dehydrogenase family protein [Gammaproteobacteria bacterium]
MRAAIYESFQGPVEVREVADPAPSDDGAVLRVEATGICRSDWHGWMGHDPDITVPHVPGHELAGVVEAVGKSVRHWRAGDRVTVPFVCACGNCLQCETGNQQVCDYQTQPGFTHWGSYAEYVGIDYADTNLVALPGDIAFDTAASLGCRFATSFRAVAAQGKVEPGSWLAVHGCGGVGLSAVMIARALEARVIAIDVDEDALLLARECGAEAVVHGGEVASVIEAVKEISGGGVHISLDALGSAETCFNSIANLRKRGRHVQVGLMAGDNYRPALPMELVIAKELEIVGSHGMQAFKYPRMLDMISAGKLAPGTLIRQHVDLDKAAAALGNPASLHIAGVTIIDRF